MKKGNIFMLASLSMGFMACSSGDELESLKSQLSEKRTEMTSLKKDMKSLETKIDSLEGIKEDKRLIVAVKQLKEEKFESYVKVHGVVESDNNVEVMPEGQGGIIRSVLVKRGASVKAGQVLAYIDADVISKQIKQLETNLEFATTMYEKQKALFDQNVGTEVQLLQAKNNKESLEKNIESLRAQKSMNTIKAPISGRIDEVYGSVGEMANQMKPFARIVNTNNAYISTDLSEAFIGRIKVGDQVKITFPNAKEPVISKVSYVSAYINPNNRTFKVQVELPKTNNVVVPNMLTKVEFKNVSYPKVIVINNTAINTDLNGDYVFVIEKKGNQNIAKKMSVTRAETYQNLTVINEGLSKDMFLVTNRYQNLDNGDEVLLKN